MNIEKALRNYLNLTGGKIKYDRFIESASGNGDAIVNVIFKLVNEELDNIDDSKSLDRTVEVFKYLGVLLVNNDNINRGIVKRRLSKLDEKLDRIEIEKSSKLDIKHLRSELDKIRREVNVYMELNESHDTKKYEFMRYLINVIKNMEYIECTFKNMPSLVNLKDKDEVPLFINLIYRFLENVEYYNEEDVVYYYNLISYVLNQSNFNLSISEKRDCLDAINKCVNRLSFSKKVAKKNKAGLMWLDKLVDVIKSIDEDRKDIKNIADKYNVHVFFDDDMIDKAKLARTSKEGKMTGRENVDDFIITIDGENALEIDDALSCKRLPNGNYLLGVHIASVLGYFSYDSDIVQEALNRTRAVYLSRRYQIDEKNFSKAIPMFPYEFSGDVASLREGEPKLARSYFFEIDKEGNIVNERFTKSIVKNDRRMTYSEVNDVINNGSCDKNLQDTINNLNVVATMLDKKYHGSELYRQIKENSLDLSDLRVGDTKAENIVYQAMLLTGRRVAEFFSSNNFPCLYRVHEIDNENSSKIQEMVDNLTATYGGKDIKKIYQLIEGLYPKGWYASSGRHDGLGVEHYCHCTSALRRAADIVVEHALEVCYDKEPTEEELSELLEEIENRANEINNKQGPIGWFAEEYQRVYRKR